MMEPPQGTLPINAEVPVGQPSSLPKPISPQPAELQYYRGYHAISPPIHPILTSVTVHLFYTRFLEQMPMIHLPTFNPDSKPPILISAMQACGALYVKSQSAINFIASTLASARDEVVAAFVGTLPVIGTWD